MSYFKVEYQWKTRPWYRKGTVKRDTVTFAAPDLTTAYTLAQDEGAKRWPSRKWAILSVSQIA